MHSRAFWSRLGLAALGAICVCAAAYIGLGWALWSHQGWAYRGLGSERVDRYSLAYAHVLGVIDSKDRDGDGIADGWEFYFHLSSRGASNGDLIRYAERIPGFVPFDTSFEQVFDPSALDWPEPVLARGERRRIRARLTVGKSSAVFASGMHVLVTPSPSGLPALPGAPPSQEPLMVPVAADGSLEFDIAIPADAGDSPPYGDAIWVVSGLSHATVGRSLFRVLRKRPPISPEAGVVWEGSLGQAWTGCKVRLQWPADAGAGAYVVEATRDTLGDEWFQLGVCARNITARVFGYELDNTDPRFRGPMRFRVVPTEAPSTP